MQSLHSQLWQCTWSLKRNNGFIFTQPLIFRIGPIENVFNYKINKNWDLNSGWFWPLFCIEIQHYFNRERGKNASKAIKTSIGLVTKKMANGFDSMLLEHLLTPAQAYKIHTIVQSGVKIIAVIFHLGERNSFVMRGHPQCGSFKIVCVYVMCVYSPAFVIHFQCKYFVTILRDFFRGRRKMKESFFGGFVIVFSGYSLCARKKFFLIYIPVIHILYTNVFMPASATSNLLSRPKEIFFFIAAAFFFSYSIYFRGGGLEVEESLTSKKIRVSEWISVLLAYYKSEKYTLIFFGQFWAGLCFP